MNFVVLFWCYKDTYNFRNYQIFEQLFSFFFYSFRIPYSERCKVGNFPFWIPIQNVVARAGFEPTIDSLWYYLFNLSK